VTAESARLFAALELPDPIRDALRDWRESAVGSDDAWRPVATDALHVTLCFLGDQPVRDIDAIARVCAELRFDPAPLLTLAAPRALPHRRPRVLAVALDAPDGALAAIQRQLARKLAAGGWYELEARPYLAHVTVARAAGRGSRPQVGSLPDVPTLSFAGTNVSLLRSRLGGGGARYERLTTVTLGRACMNPQAPGSGPEAPG
jgi:2'-5' RNA ligase